jgi:uncharacterized repeat protein (TIGR04138 family)
MADSSSSSYETLFEALLAAERDFPADAYHFVQQGVQYTSTAVHGAYDEEKPQLNRHVTGQELAHGLRDYAVECYGPLARTVLRHWNIRSTYDFGRIVYAMINAGILQKQPTDSIDDFRDVYDFKADFPSVVVHPK